MAIRKRMRLAAIEAATRTWISKFVVHERLCPFAASSRMLIQVETFGGANDDDKTLARRMDQCWRLDPLSDRSDAARAVSALWRMEHGVGSLLSEETETYPSSNLFIVFPVGLLEMDVFEMFVSMLAQRTELPLAGVTGEGADAPAVMFPFHPHMQAHGTPDYKFASPFPMVHVIPGAELSRARNQLKERKAAGKACLLTRNMRLMREATDAKRAAWDDLLQTCRSPAVPG